MVETDRPPLLVFADDWGRHPSSCQHLIRRLLPNRQVWWINTIGMRKPSFSLDTLKRGFEKITHWTHKSAPPSLPENLRIGNPRMWPWFTHSWDRTLNRLMLSRALKKTIAAMPAPPIAVTTLPIVADLMDSLPVARWVYYCVDDFGQWPGLDQGTLRLLEGKLVAKSHDIIAVSEHLQQRLQGMGRSSQLLTHGVDLGFWQTGSGKELPELAGLERPLVMFYGVVDRRMDIEFVRKTAKELTAGTLVFVGPHNEPDPELKTLPRVAFVPPVAFERLPAIANQASVLIMPYADLSVTRAIQPLKMKEYLAIGKPVVVRNLPATRSWSDCMDLADSPDRFADLVIQRLRGGVPNDQQQARTRLQEESWEKKAELFERWVVGSER